MTYIFQKWAMTAL